MMQNTHEPNQCERLRETRERLNSLIRRDRETMNRLHTKIRRINIEIADAEVELRALGGAAPPSIPGTLPPRDDDERERHRNRNRLGQLGDIVDAITAPVENRIKRRELERRLRSLRHRREENFTELIPINRSYDDLLADCHQARQDMRQLDCFNP